MTDWRAQEAEFRARVRDNGRAEETAPSAESTEHTEHSGASSHGERDRVFGLGGEHSTEHAPNTVAATTESLTGTTS